MTRSFDFIELFAGIGGFRTAMERLGGRCVMSSEINEFAQKSYRALYDGAEELRGDVTKIDANDVPDHDILVGGFPCQAFSIAGKQRGFEDARGTLFFEIARIATVKRPKLMFLENVPNLLGHNKGRTIKTICRILNDIGYAFDFNILNSKYYDLAQDRDRVFIIASLEAEHEDWYIPKDAKNLLYSTKRELITTHRYRTFNFDWPTSRNITKCIRDIEENNVQEKYYLKGDKVDLLLEKVKEKDNKDRVFDTILVGTLELPGKDQWNRVYHPDGLSPTLTTMQGGRQEPKIIEAQQFSDGSGLAYALDTGYPQGIGLSVDKGRRTHIIEKGEKSYRIRKMTPLECWRLQGFSDEQFFKAKNAGVSDSQLYKQAGNAVSIPVIEAIGRNLIKIIDHVPFRRNVVQRRLF